MPLWTAAHQASLSFTISQSLVKLTSIESVTPSNHLILCYPLLLLPLIFLNIMVFKKLQSKLHPDNLEDGVAIKGGEGYSGQVCRGLVLGSLELRCLLDFSGKRPGRQFCSWDQKRHFLQISSFCSKLQFFLSWLTFRNERGENEKCTRKSI